VDSTGVTSAQGFLLVQYRIVRKFRGT